MNPKTSILLASFQILPYIANSVIYNSYGKKIGQLIDSVMAKNNKKQWKQ